MYSDITDEEERELLDELFSTVSYDEEPDGLPDDPDEEDEAGELIEKHASHDQSRHGNRYQYTDAKNRLIQVKDPKSPIHIDEIDFDNYESRVEWAQSVFDVDIEVEGKIVKARVGLVENSADPSWGLAISGQITSDGKLIGTFNRIFDGAAVDNDYLKVSFTNKGIGTALVAHWEDQFSQAGITLMRVNAASSETMNGGYTWAKYGYTPNPGETARQIESFLDSEFVATGAEQVRYKAWISSMAGFDGADSSPSDIARNYEQLAGPDLIRLASQDVKFREYLATDGNWEGTKVPQRRGS